MCCVASFFLTGLWNCKLSYERCKKLQGCEIKKIDEQQKSVHICFVTASNNFRIKISGVKNSCDEIILSWEFWCYLHAVNHFSMKKIYQINSLFYVFWCEPRSYAPQYILQKIHSPCIMCSTRIYIYIYILSEEWKRLFQRVLIENSWWHVCLHMFTCV